MDDEPDNLMNEELEFEKDGVGNDHREFVTVLLWSIRQGWAEPDDLLKAEAEYEIEWPEYDSMLSEETEQESLMRVLCPEAWAMYEWARAYGEDPQSLLDKFSGVSINASDAEKAEECDWWQDAYDQDLESLLDKLSGVSASDEAEAEEYDW